MNTPSSFQIIVLFAITASGLPPVGKLTFTARQGFEIKMLLTTRGADSLTKTTTPSANWVPLVTNENVAFNHCRRDKAVDRSRKFTVVAENVLTDRWRRSEH